MKQQWSVFDRNIRWRPWGCHNSLRTQAFGWVSLIGTTAIFIWILNDLWDLKQQHLAAVTRTAETQTRLEEIQTAVSRPPEEASPSIPLDSDTRRGLNRVTRHLNTPWPGVFDTLERLTPPDVALIRIEPDGNGMVTIEAESTEFDKLMAYTAGLEHQGVFAAVSLRRHVTNDRDPNRPARLMFQLALKEDAK